VLIGDRRFFERDDLALVLFIPELLDHLDQVFAQFSGLLKSDTFWGLMILATCISPRAISPREK
jgi:hypothetical protein